MVVCCPRTVKQDMKVLAGLVQHVEDEKCAPLIIICESFYESSKYLQGLLAEGLVLLQEYVVYGAKNAEGTGYLHHPVLVFGKTKHLRVFRACTAESFVEVGNGGLDGTILQYEPIPGLFLPDYAGERLLGDFVIHPDFYHFLLSSFVDTESGIFFNK